MKDYILMTASWLVMLFIQIVGIIAGLFLVPLGLFFRKTDPSTSKPFSVFNIDRQWVYEDLPDWLKPWQNIEDGLRGDHRGWWDANSYGSDGSKVFNMFWWSAIRNPFNYFKRFVLGCDVRNYVIYKLAGQDYVRDDFKSVGWQLLKARPLHKSGIKLPRYMYYGVFRYGSSDRALVIQLGNKIKLSHNSDIEADEYDYFKGFTFEINPFKDIS